MLRIAKFKLNEVTRNIKHGQLKPLEKLKDPKEAGGREVSPE